jgi:hypothetical protein
VLYLLDANVLITASNTLQMFAKRYRMRRDISISASSRPFEQFANVAFQCIRHTAPEGR